ncbi:MAG: tRNA (adenosine(37)-N6)-threonylcarbamoyltransferase complex transferase subunit TsaD [Pseudomonadota bacterium]
MLSDRPGVDATLQRKEGGNARKAPNARASQSLTVLAVETSCDECAAAVVTGRPGAMAIKSNVVWSQIDDHAAFGGVVPEIAARAHLKTVAAVVRTALNVAGTGDTDFTHIAATNGPGLLGGLLVGSSFAKGYAQSAHLPFYPVNHLEAHVLTPRLTDGTRYPYCVALLSGGHAQFVAVRGLGDYVRLGGTIDDAAGEAFDKTAKLLGLGFPGGPAVERAAANGTERFTFPVPLARRAGCDLSFAGLKTAVRLAAEAEAPLSEAAVADICTSFQATVARLLKQKTAQALVAFHEVSPEPPTALVAVGGVAANQALRRALQSVADAERVAFVAPPLALCTDNAAMVAAAALEHAAAGAAPDLTARARSRWPLDADAAALLGGGKRGVKA